MDREMVDWKVECLAALMVFVPVAMLETITVARKVQWMEIIMVDSLEIVEAAKLEINLANRKVVWKERLKFDNLVSEKVVLKVFWLELLLD
jgi:hypothetical protein